MHIPAMNADISGNAMKFFSTIMPIVAFDVLGELQFYEDFIKRISRNEIQKKNERRLQGEEI